MSALVVPRDEVIRQARAVLDRARLELAADYAAGRLTGERLAEYERLRAIAAARASAAATTQAA